MAADIFISYSRRDFGEVQRIARCLDSAGVRVWVDKDEIEGGTNYGLKISRGIQACKVLMLMCSNASMQSRNVKQEIQLAWKYERPYIPLLLEPINFPEQVEYWLEGWQWIEVLGAPPERWLPKVMRALTQLGVRHEPLADGETPAPNRQELPDHATPAAGKQEPPRRPDETHAEGAAGAAGGAACISKGLAGLREVASFTGCIWPLPADKVPGGAGARETFRGLGAPQAHVQHTFSVGSDVCLAIETGRDGHLLMLDEGPEGITYCLCPSSFAPTSLLSRGRHYLPQPGSRYDAFRITGSPGREHLLAVISDQPLGMNWMPADPYTPARVLDDTDIESLLAKLRSTDPGSWIALATYFDIVS
jgi:hypothetical protein